jgi:non-ribosomal peptide synthase protein (TIGR01720 family)
MALLAGATLVLVEEAEITDPARFTKHLEREGVTVATITPPHLAALDRHPLPTIRVLIMAGDVADPETAQHYAQDRTVFNAYGPTEVSVCASIHLVVPGAPDGPVPIGRTVAGSQIHILDRFGRKRPPGSRGEIVFEGPGVARGYLRRDSAAFVTLLTGARAYHTGDAGRFTADGELIFLGRIDQQVKLRGYRVEPTEIAHALARHPQVREAHVAPMRALSGQLELAAYVVPRAATELWPSIAEFFVYDDLAYGAMAGDETRNTAYRSAFARHLPGRTVLEIGPGAEAVLSRMAIAAGARKVYAVEINPAVAEQARVRLRAEGLTERVEVITGDITQVTLPERCDICISEIVGAIGGSEGAAILIEASRRWLKDPAAQLPARSVTQLAGLSLAGIIEQLVFPEAAAAYVNRIFAQAGRRFDLRLCLKNLPQQRILTSAGILEDLDYRLPLGPQSQHEVRLEVTAPGSVDALLAWLHLIVDADHPEEAVDILASKGSWLPVVLPLSMPSPDLLPGDTIVATVTRTLSDNGLNPDFRVEGAFRRGAVALGHFDCRSWHVAPDFRQTPLHRAAFQTDGAPRRTAPLPARLRAHLEGLLPSWMMPAHIIPVERLPLTASGKVDRKALPAPTRGVTAFAQPTGLMEAAVAAAMGEVLGLPAIGADDDFFQLGGDSIRAIQIAAKLGAQGITLNSTDILAARKVAAMAKLAKGRPMAAQGPSSGPFPPTPIQAWFLNRWQGAPHHFNQSMLLRAAERLDASAMARALEAIAAHHDVLRSRFRWDGEQWTAEILETELPVTVELIETRLEDLAGVCARVQASLDLGAGTLFRAAILRLPDADRLLWVVHHLVVDWVSWRALLPDLQMAYGAARRDEAFVLPPRSDGFVTWAREVAARAAAPEWQEDATWWRNLAAGSAVRLPLMVCADPAGEAAFLSASLDAAQTVALLDGACRKHEADMQDLLLAALAVAVRPLCGLGTLHVIVEGHGREGLLAPLEVSRTVGWFTSFHPVAIPVAEAEGPAPVASVREALRAVPRRGLGYLLQAMRPGGIIIPAEIGLNYLGRMEEPSGAAILRVADEPAGPNLDPHAARPLPVEILAQITEERLHIAITFTPRRIALEAVQELLDGMITALTGLGIEAGSTPDTRLAGLHPEVLDDVLSGWN